MQLFLRAQTQWRTGPGGIIGLDYLALEMLTKLYATGLPASLLEDIQVMEGEILQKLHEREK